MNYVTNSSDIGKRLLERFIKYVKTWSESDSAKADAGIIPSTPQQKLFAETLAEEMKTIGLQQVTVTPECYIYGCLPPSAGLEKAPSFCLLAHIDTVDEVTGKDVNPIIHTDYDGTRIDLKSGCSLDPAEDEYLALAAAARETIITGDGTTLLGADDKAGIAEIMTAAEYIIRHDEIKHGKIEIIFSPDEETGHGMDKVPLHLLSSKRAYTVDGGHIGQLETECFNAFCTTVEFTGNPTHTGDARKNGMVNAVMIASQFLANIPADQRPETTDGYEGFFAPLEISGGIEKTTVYILLRDFSMEGIERRMKLITRLAETAAEAAGGSVILTHRQQYLNMKQKLAENPQTVKNLEKAYKNAGIEPEYVPIRGGTDGSRLTEMGIPTPNIFTGGHNYHSHTEWASLPQMCAAADILINLAIITGAENV